MEANFDLTTLNNNHWNTYVVGQIFRIVVIPGRLQYRADFSDYDATIRNLGLENTPVKSL